MSIARRIEASPERDDTPLHVLDGLGVARDATGYHVGVAVEELAGRVHDKIRPMLQRAQQYVFTAPALAIYPGLAITIVVLAFNFLGDGLRDALDPRRRR